MAQKISLIITTKNETRSISTLLDSIANQTRRPDEVIISDASDTPLNIENSISKELNLCVVELVPGANRSVGRNRAIAIAKYEYVLITDAGCRLKNTWVQEMAAGFQTADVVAGYYEGECTTIFEKCQIPYVLVMPDKIDKNNFLPATRSMGITKTAWKKSGKFNENLRYAEDYEFARRLLRQGWSITFVPSAIVYWRPRMKLSSFGRMIYEHAYGDGYAKSFRPKVLTIYGRYILIVFVGMMHGPWVIVPLVVYLVYAIQKNYRYVNDPRAFVFLPLLQIVSDFAVMIGTAYGLLQRFFKGSGLDRDVSHRR